MVWWVPLAAAAVDAISGANQANRQMRFQREMASTQYQRSAADLEAAGLNRILAMTQPSASPSGAMAPPTDFAQAAIQGATAKQAIETQKAQEELLRAQKDKTEAESANVRTQTMIATEMLPVHKDQGLSSAEQSREQAALARVNTMIGDLEEDKQRVLKSLYTEFGPVIIDAVRAIKDMVTGAKGPSTFSAAADSVLSAFGHSAKAERQATYDEKVAIAKAFEKAVLEGDIPAEKVKDLSKDIREIVLENNPGWRNLK